MSEIVNVNACQMFFYNKFLSYPYGKNDYLCTIPGKLSVISPPLYIMRKRFKIFWAVLAFFAIIIFLAISNTLTKETYNSGSGSAYNDYEYEADDSMAPAMEAPSNFGFSRSKSEVSEAMMDDSGNGGVDTNNDVDDINRMIVRTGYFSITVKDVPSAVDSINKYAEANGGYVVSSKIEEVGIAPIATVKIRVPAEMFDEGVGTIKSMGVVKSESVEGKDVTEEYVDLEARLDNFKATEEQYLEIMKQAKDVEDILNVQEYLSDIREVIERTEGRMKYLRESASMSTITIYLATDADNLPVVNESEKWEPIAVFKSSLRGLLEVAKSVSYLAIWFVVYIPLWALILFVIWGTRKIWRKFNGSNKKR